MKARLSENNLIFESYLKQRSKLVSEAPVYGDENMGSNPRLDRKSSTYGIEKVAKRDLKSKEEVYQTLLTAIKDRLFKKEAHVVDGKPQVYYYPGSPMKFRSELQDLISDVLNLDGKTDAVRTARVVHNILNVINKDNADQKVSVQKTKLDDALAKSLGIDPADLDIPEESDNGKTIWQKNENTRMSIRRFVPVFASLPDEIETPSDVASPLATKNFYKEVAKAFRNALGPDAAENTEDINDFINILKEKQPPVYEKRSAGKPNEELEDTSSLDDSDEDLRDVLNRETDRGYDKDHSYENGIDWESALD